MAPRQVFFALFAASALLLGGTEPAHAYLDPGTGSVLLQAIIGSVAAGLLVFKLYWARLKEVVSRVISRRKVTRDGATDPRRP